MKRIIGKRGLSLLLALVLCLSLLPAAALAEGDDYGTAEAFFFTPAYTSETEMDWGDVLTVLPTAPDGSVAFALSAFPSDPGYEPADSSDITFVSLYSKNAGDYILYDSYYYTGSDGFNPQYGGEWYEGALTKIRIEDAQPGVYSVKLLMNDSEKAFVHENAVTIVDGSDVSGRPVISTSRLPDGRTGTAYDFQLEAQSDTAVTWSLTFGSLPSGLSLSESGRLTGTPTREETASFTLRVSNDSGFQEKTFSLVVRIPAAGITVNGPITDGFPHFLTVTRQGDAEPVRTVSLGSRDIELTALYSVTGLTPGDYTVTFSAQRSGAAVTYSNPSADFTVTAGKDPSVSLTPGSVTVGPDETSVMVTVENYRNLRNGPYSYVQLTLSDGSKLRLDLSLNDGDAGRVFFTNALAGGKTLTEASLLGTDGFNQLFDLTGGTPVISGRQATLQGDLSKTVRYTLELQAGVTNVLLTNNTSNSSSYRYFTDKESFWMQADAVIPGGYRAQGTSSAMSLYDLSAEPSLAVEGSGMDRTLRVTYPELSRTASITGTITDGASPLAGVTITGSQSVNQITRTISAVTDDKGIYILPNLAENSGPVSVTAEKAGYRTATGARNPGEALDLTMEPMGGIAVTIEDGMVLSPYFSWKGAGEEGSLNASTDSAFFLPIPSDTNGKVTVTMTSYGTVGQTTGTCDVKDGAGSLTLSPSRMGWIDWSGMDPETGELTYNYGGYTVRVKNDRGYTSQYDAGARQRIQAVPDTYTVDILSRDREGNDTVAASQTLTVASGETAYFIPDVPAIQNATAAGSVTAPDGAAPGELYQVSGIITAAGGDKLNGIACEIDYGSVYNGSILVKGAIINGKRVSIDGSGSTYAYLYAGRTNKDVDWSLPLRFTFYCVQGCSASGEDQLVTISAIDSSGNRLPVGSAATTSVPSLTLSVSQTVGQSGVLSFYGRTTSGADVRLYDNDSLLSVVRASNSGVYQGSAPLRSGDLLHTIRAETTGTASVTATCRYDPNGAALTGLWLNGSELPIDGRTTSYRHHANSSYQAAFDKPERLKEITATVDGKETRGKVFFRVETLAGPRVLPGITSDGGKTWVATGYFGEAYPTGVTVLYRSEPVDYSTETAVTFDNEVKETFRTDTKYVNVKRTSGPTWDDWMDAVFQDFTPALQDAEDSASLMDNSGWRNASSNELMNYFAGLMTQQCGEGEAITAINAEQASMSADELARSGGLNGDNWVQYRTYADQPTWTTREGNVRWRTEELLGSGYRSATSEYADGSVIVAFSGTFYYTDNLYPSTKPPTDRDGNATGSVLNVVYYYVRSSGSSLSGGKWFRTQNAYMTAKARSPIHTVANQIPKSTDAPYRYTPASELMDAFDDRNSQMKKHGYAIFKDGYQIKVKTWANMMSSLLTFGYGKYYDAINKNFLFGFKGFFEGINGQNITGALGSVGLGWANDCIYGCLKEDELVNKPSNLDGITNTLIQNRRYWSKNLEELKAQHSPDDSALPGFGVNDFSAEIAVAETMIKRTDDMLGWTYIVSHNLSTAESLNQYVEGQSGGFTWLGLISGFEGPELSLLCDSGTFTLNSYNDTAQTVIKEQFEDYLSLYSDYIDSNDYARSSILNNNLWRSPDMNPDLGDQVHQLPGCISNPSPLRPNPTPQDAGTSANFDPAGIVYEAVLSNPVEGATVTLYRYDGSPMTVWDDSDNLNQPNPVITDEKGAYRWDVPEGEWYVAAVKYGYEPGSSQNDVEATRSHDGTSYLPVLPPQLNVNIPLVSYDEPEILSVDARTDGVYVTFSKYMDESSLTAGDFSVNGEAVTPELLNSEQAPDNINYGGDAPSYTSVIKLPVQLTAGNEAAVSVPGTLRSYAGVPLVAPYAETVSVQGKETLAAPTFSVAGGEIESGTAVTLQAAEGAKILYTTDGSVPTAENGTKARSGETLTLIIDTTLKAIAVKPGCETSPVAEAKYTIPMHTMTYTPAALTTAAVESVEASGSEAKAVVTCTDASATVFCAAYRSSGQMVAAKFVPVQSGTSKPYTFDLGTTDHSKVKVMVLDSGSKPICAAKEAAKG